MDVNNSQVCVASSLAEYPLLVLAFDIDPLFIVLNKVTVAMIAKADHRCRGPYGAISSRKAGDMFHFIIRSVGKN